MIPLLALVAACGLFAPAPPQAEDVQTYDVKKGDTLGKIAKSWGVTVDDLRAWNHVEGDLIEVGQVLEIHAPPKPSAPTKPRSRVATARPAASGLELPAAQTCLAGPDVAADEGMAASEGLSYGQLKSSMDAFLGNTLRCVPEGGIDATLALRIRVACTGRVADVTVTDPGAAPPEVARCVADTLRFAPFPAHDMPDGFTFDYPLAFTAGG